MVEETNLHGAEVESSPRARRGENVLYPGEDVRAGAIALEAGTRLEAAELGGLAALGRAQVTVRRAPANRNPLDRRRSSSR